MKISEQWLREWVSPKLDTTGLAQRLTLAGLEVSAIEPVAPALAKVVVGEIVALGPHPNTERLTLCNVNIGKARALDIVCGAPNARAGIKVPVALVGAALANGTVIKKTAVRGVESAGMLCSAAELGLEEASSGLLVLEEDNEPGQSISDALQLDDSAIDIDLTPNRGDCLSVAGIAREVAALTGARLKAPKINPVPARGKRQIEVSLKAGRDCPHYVGRVIEDIDPRAATPMWMKERLRRSGLRSLGPVVDVTNYVLLELGQPMHAFDLDKLDGGIRVVPARGGESLALLDGTTIKVDAGTLLIADAHRPLALAGIMGGQDSAVSDATRHLMLESAYFAPDAIAGRARTLGLHTESSHRFERGVDPAVQRLAVERATALLLQIVGGRAGPVVERKDARYLPKRAGVPLRPAFLQRLLGIKLAPARIETILKRLQMTVKKAGGGWRVTAPSYRFDIEREVDLIEEVARVYGYDNIPGAAPLAPIAPPPVPETRVPERRLRQALVDREYQEVITYSFVDPALQAMLEPGLSPATLANPIAADMAAMRTSLWPGLLQALQYNQNRQQTRMRLFEIGGRFRPAGETVAQESVVAGAVSGTVWSKQWGAESREVDFFDVKADSEALLQLAGGVERFDFNPVQHPALHPGQAAEITAGDRQVGLLGALHPEIQTALGLDRPVVLFELEIAALQGRNLPEFREISRFPAIRQDIAVVVDAATPARAVADVITDVAGKLLVNLELFDDYRGEGIDSGRKNLALGLTLQDSSRTLKEGEAETVRTRVIEALASRLGAQLRE